jgi:8-oxo-dGTP pyrophosphatase MutT (NUDIX family)
LLNKTLTSRPCSRNVFVNALPDGAGAVARPPQAGAAAAANAPTVGRARPLLPIQARFQPAAGRPRGAAALPRARRRSIFAGMDAPRFNLAAIGPALAAAPGAESSDYDLNPEVAASLDPARPLRPAAVLVALVERGGALKVVLTRRAAGLRRHGGQVAFPGGRVDPGDASLAAAALREAWEEVGLEPDAVELLGALDRHETVTRFSVTPFVGRVRGRFEPRPDPAEVAEVFEAPLAFLLDPANLQIHRRRWQGGWRQYYVIPYGPHYIWGATARMLKSLADRLA